MVRRILAPLVVSLTLLGACADAPEPGNLAVFCSLLEAGTGLADSPLPEDLSDLEAVAPPEIRDTIETLRNRARDFNELLAEQPPDLEALFNARFNPEAQIERSELDAYAEDACGLVVARPPSTRWNAFVAETRANALWAELVTAQFDVSGDQIISATLNFVSAPEPLELAEQACQGAADFLRSEGAVAGAVSVLIGTVIVLEHDIAQGECRLP